MLEKEKKSDILLLIIILIGAILRISLLVSIDFMEMNHYMHIGE